MVTLNGPRFALRSVNSSPVSGVYHGIADLNSITSASFQYGTALSSRPPPNVLSQPACCYWEQVLSDWPLGRVEDLEVKRVGEVWLKGAPWAVETS